MVGPLPKVKSCMPCLLFFMENLQRNKTNGLPSSEDDDLNMQKWEHAQERPWGAEVGAFANKELYNNSDWSAGNRVGMENNTRAKPFSGSVDGLIH